jgi:hypothetical protein
MTDEKVSHEEVRQILSRFNASHFRLTDREHARYSIPADPKRDDDIRLGAYINQQKTIAAQLDEAVDRLWESLAPLQGSAPMLAQEIRSFLDRIDKAKGTP